MPPPHPSLRHPDAPHPEERALMPAFRTRHLCSVAAALVLTVTAPATAVSAATDSSSAAALREVMFVGNNWDGTADVIKSTGDFAKVGRINVIPDQDQRMAE